MKIIEPYYEILNKPKSNFILTHLEKAARLCYKSEDKIKKGSAKVLLKSLNKNGHQSIFEHISISVLIVCDRGISHEIVRHRLCSFSQESTRYANYSKNKFNNEITVIKPLFYDEYTNRYNLWKNSIKVAEQTYLTLIDYGSSAQEARSVLPNSLKTEIIVTANIREWKHIFNLRCSNKAHPQIRQIMIPLRDEFIEMFPEYYSDLIKGENN